jgi:hypothetical protein
MILLWNGSKVLMWEGSKSRNQGCQVAVVTAPLFNSGHSKLFGAVKN